MSILRFVFCLALLASTCNFAGAQDNVKELFNGKDLSGWKGKTELWTVKDGCITGTTSAENPLKSNTFLVWQDGEVADFELDLDYKIQGGNSGIQYRSKVVNPEGFVVAGYQADIDATLKFAGINYEEKGRGILTQRGQKTTIGADGKRASEQFATAEELGQAIHADDWNHYRVVAKGNTLSHYINDKLMSQVIDEQTDKAASKGVLALQIHTGPPMVIQFKNIRLKQVAE